MHALVTHYTRESLQKDDSPVEPVKDDLGPPPPHPPHKRRQLEQAPAIWLAIWADNKEDKLTPSELRRVKEERERRKERVVPVVVGFTGTREGMTPAQRAEVRTWLEGASEAHHGDCVGGDEQFHEDCLKAGVPVVIHPPENNTLRAWCKGAIRVEKALPFLERNKEIVRASTLVVGAPKEMHEPPPQRGQGTWSTIRFARNRDKGLQVVWPDGSTEDKERVA